MYICACVVSCVRLAFKEKPPPQRYQRTQAEQRRKVFSAGALTCGEQSMCMLSLSPSSPSRLITYAYLPTEGENKKKAFRTIYVSFFLAACLSSGPPCWLGDGWCKRAWGNRTATESHQPTWNIAFHSKSFTKKTIRLKSWGVRF